MSDEISARANVAERSLLFCRLLLLPLGMQGAMEAFYDNHFIHGLMVTYFRVNHNCNTEAVKSTMYEF